jgi:hypothetical protein
MPQLIGVSLDPTRRVGGTDRRLGRLERGLATWLVDVLPPMVTRA